MKRSERRGVNSALTGFPYASEVAHSTETSWIWQLVSISTFPNARRPPATLQ